MPLVSVIIPNFNHAPFLNQRIESVLNQSFLNFELIILDDNSNDNSKEIIERFRSNKKVSYIVLNKKNSGSPFIQWQKGIELAKGDYIWIAESDDFSEVDFLEKCVEVLDTNSELSLVFCKTLPVDSKGNVINNISSTKPTGSYHANNNDFFYNWFFLNEPFRIMNASACVFRMSFLTPNIFDKIVKHRFSGDKLFWFLLVSSHPDFYYLDLTLNYQRQHINTTRAKVGIASEYQRNLELSEIYRCYLKQGLLADKKAYIEIGKRLLSKNIFGIFEYKAPNLLDIMKSMYWVGFDYRFYKRIARIILKRK